MSTRRGFFAGLAGTLALMHIGAHPAKAASGLVNGQSDALGAESIGTPITITAIGLGANALVVLSIEANAGEDIFGLHIEKFGAGCRRVVSKWNLLEISVAPLPCNQEALATAVSKGLSLKFAKSLGYKAAKDDELPAEPEMQTCSKCKKEFAPDEMTMADEKPVCADCMKEKAATAPVTKRVIREVAGLQPAPQPSPATIKRVHHFVECAAKPAADAKANEQVKILEQISNTLAKQRGRLYVG